MKNKSFIIPVAIIGLILIAIGVGVYHVNKQKTPSAPTNGTADNSITASSSLRDLLASNKTAICKFSYFNFSNSVSGTLYFAGPMMRGDLSVKNGPSAYETFILRSDGKVYLWSAKQGIEMTAEDFQSTTQSQNASINLDQNVDYTCANSTPDPGKFKLPGGVIFLPSSTSAK